MKEIMQSTDQVATGLVAVNHAAEGLIAHGHVVVECRDSDGNLKWVEAGPNLIVTAGRNDLLDKTLAGSTYTAAWYMGLVDNAGFSAIAAADTMASHAGWAEADEYASATRPAITFAAASAGSKATASAVSFAINGTVTVNGVFVTSVNTKNGTTGTLFAAKSFGATRAVVDGDTLNVTYTASLTAS